MTISSKRIFMSIKVGLVGLPNVGKSSLFNALTKSSVPAENYPFCTIDPHIAITPVFDERSPKLKEFYGSKKELPATISFVDIAGLVKGAASGQGLGNQFLSHIREVDLIIHVLRCFEDPNVIRQEGNIDPINDFEVIVNELMLKDLESVEKRLQKLESELKKHGLAPIQKKEYETEKTVLAQVFENINNGNAQEVRSILQANPTATQLPLLSSKNFLVVANLSELEIDNYENNPHYQALVTKFGLARVIPICVKTENELSQLPAEEAQEMMEMLGIKAPALQIIIKKSYDNLGLITFFTCGPQEIHAWPIKQGITIRKASGEIHSDLERGFICAEIFNYNDLIQVGSIKGLKDKGKVRTEGAEYLVQDGDIILVRFNV